MNAQPTTESAATDRKEKIASSYRSWIDTGAVVCPACHGALAIDTTAISCRDCRQRYPVHAGTPALFTSNSAFASVSEAQVAEDQVAETSAKPGSGTGETATEGRGTYFEAKLTESPVKRRLRRALPTLAKDHGADRIDQRLRQALAELEQDDLKGLVVGAGERPEAVAGRFPAVSWLATDVDAGFGPILLADVQDLPLANASVDVVIAEMVLEHVMNPIRAATELERVVRPGGLLLITVPFCFPWHGIPIDFFRCTPAGLRALFRHTEVLHLDRGMGPWGGVAYALDAALTNLTNVRLLRRATVVLSRFVFGGLAVLDRLALGGGRGLVNPASITLLAQRDKTRRTDAEILDELRQRFGHGPG